MFADYISSVFKNSFVEWDVKTITAGDYTVEYDIPKIQFENFCKSVYDGTEMISKASSFRNYIKEEIQRRLTELPSLGYEEDVDQIKIASVQLAFDNAALVNLLRKRGLFIKQQKFDKMRELDAQIDKFRTENDDKLNRPVSAFLSFENEEGLNRCLQYHELIKDDQTKYAGWDKLLEGDLKFEPASEPTDIIWENRHFTTGQRFVRSVIVTCIIGFLLVCSFLGIFSASKYAKTKQLKYGTPNCANYEKK